MRSTDVRPNMPRARWGLWPFVVGSLAAHVGLLAFVMTWGTVPDLGLDFELPAEVEFGVADGLTLNVAQEEGTPAEAEPSGAEPSPGDVGVDAEEAPPPKKPKREPKKAESAEEKAANVGADGEPVRIPPGAQLALRLDVRRIRESPLAPDVERLMTAIPDWQAVLGGAGIDPLRDLDRILIASPNLQRSRALFAGRHAGDDELARRAVANLAAREGDEASWSVEHGVPTAPWRDEDRVGRKLALLGSSHFAIARGEDLPRLLAVAQARQANAPDDGNDHDPEAWGRALLSMEPNDALSFEVEGARQFVRGTNAHVPVRLRLAASDEDGRLVRVYGEGSYDSAEEAETAAQFWSGIRDSYAGNAFIAFSGLARPLREATIAAEGKVLRFETRLALGHMRLILGYLEGMLARPALQADRASPPESRPTP